jgi:hypothetical protein
MHYQRVLLCLRLEHVPGTPGFIPEWKRALVFDRWRANWELPLFEQARRLAYLVDHYRPALTYDLTTFANLDLGTLWRARRWAFLVDVLDRLPAHSHYAASVSNDPEHAKMLAEAIMAQRAAGEEPASKGPALTTWTPEMAMLTNIFDAVRGVSHAVVAVQAGKGKKPEPPKPAPRPETPLENMLRIMEYERRKAKHEALVARVLPKKRKSQPPVH